MSATAPAIIRPSSRFYAAFHRYLTTPTRTTHNIHPRHPLPSRFTSRSNPQSHYIPHYYTSASTSSTTNPTSTTKPSPPSTTPPQQPTHYTLFPLTLPHGPPPGSPFTPPLRSLRSEYLSLQSSSHPDKHPSGPEKLRAEARSALINDAYRTLVSPLKRAEYILGLRGVEIGEGMVMDEDGEGEGGKEGEGDNGEGFLEQVMEVRGEIDAAGREEELEGVRRGNEGRIDGCVRELERGFEELGRCADKGEEERVVRRLVRETVRLRYWVGVRESLDGWEGGKGGGVLEH